jgi:hypothetical protein
MKALKIFLTTAAFGAVLGAGAAANAAIFFQVSLNGAAPTAVTGTLDFAGNTVGSFGSPSLGGSITAGEGVSPDLLDSQSLDVSATAGGTIDVYITDTDFAASTGSNGFLSTLTSNTLPAGWTVTEMTFVSSANAQFTGTQIASHMFSSIGTSSIGALTPVGPGPYSITEKYHIVAVGAGNSNSTIDVFSIPEPTTWALMIMGFGGVGAMVRNRRRQAAFA